MTPPAPVPAQARWWTRLRQGRAWPWVRRGFAAAMVAALALVVVTSRHDLASITRGARPWLLVAAFLMSFGQLALASSFWSACLNGVGDDVRWRSILDATLVSGPARYVPGSIWYAVGRAAILRGRGARASALATVAALEMILIAVVGFALGGILILSSAHDVAVVGPGIGAAVVVLAVVGSPPVVNLAGRVIARRRRAEFEPLRWSVHARLLGWTTAYWFWQAFNFVLYLAAFPRVHVGGPVLVAGAYMVAWGIGWLTIFAPQGVGVFEAALSTILTGHPKAGLAVLIGGYRALVAVRDVLGWAGVLLARRIWGEPQQRRAPDGAQPQPQEER